MSSHSSESPFWPLANKVIAFVIATCTAYGPVAFLYKGLQAHADTGKPVMVAQTQTSAPAASPSLPAPAQEAATPAAAANGGGQQVYMTVCFACHQPTGLGLPNMFPPLAGSDWVKAPKPDRLIRNVLHGITGPLTINGKPFTTPAPLMPPQGAALNDQQIADVLSYIRSSWGNQASAVTPEQVKTVRAAEQSRTAMWTEAELLKIADR